MKVQCGENEGIICEHLCAYMNLKYPGVQFCHIANEGSGGNAIRGAKLKRQGVRAGMPDYLFFTPSFCRVYTLLALEIKREKGIVSKSQKATLGLLAEQDSYSVYVAYGYDAAIDVIEGYLHGREFQSKQRKVRFGQ